MLAVAVNSADPDPQAIAQAAALLRAGGLVAFPTETVYGLGASAIDAASVGRVFDVKGRPASDPLIVHVADIADARGVAAMWPESAERLAQRCWPGPLTLVVERAGHIADAVGGGRSTVAVRVPAHPVALALLVAANIPVAAPSANRFGRVSPTTAAHVLDELADRLRPDLDLVLDGGRTSVGVESTVVDLSGGTARVLRPGGVSVETIQEELGQVEVPERFVAPADHAAPAPGTFLRHYAPSTPLVLVDADVEVVAALQEALAAEGVSSAPLSLPSDPDQAAAQLYNSLRSAEGIASVLLARPVAPAGIGRAVNDRLFRAASGFVVTDSSPASVAAIAALSRRGS